MWKYIKNLEQQNITKKNMLSDFKNFYKPKVFKIHCYWYKDSQIDQWDRQSPEIN